MGLFDKLFKKNKKEAVENLAEVEHIEETDELEASDSAAEANEEEISAIAESAGETTDNEVLVDSIEIEDPALGEPDIKEPIVEEPMVKEPDIDTPAIDKTVTENTDLIAEEIVPEECNEEITSDTEQLSDDSLKEEVEEFVDEIVEEFVEEAPKKKLGFFAKIKSGLTKTRDNIMSGVDNVLKSFTKIDEDLFEELEEALIMADIGVETSVYIIDKLRDKVKAEKITDTQDVKKAIIDVISELLTKNEVEFELPSPSVILVIGVNGVGKTTTIGKLTNYYKTQNNSVMLAAADTFRAAAIDQLEVWADRNKVDIIKHEENSDPGAVVFDAVQAAKARKADILICDTAGRLHNKKNLMEELRKISRIIGKEYPDAHLETLLVLDATTGQNAIQQAKLFKEVADITGIVLTKLDGTAKGGIVLAIKNEMNIPVRFIGVGEGLDDLQPFNAYDFTKALFEE